MSPDAFHTNDYYHTHGYDKIIPVSMIMSPVYVDIRSKS